MITRLAPCSAFRISDWDGFRRNVLSLASAAKLHKLPTVLTGSYVEGPNGPILDDLLKMFPYSPNIYHPGPISAWDDPILSKAVEALGRKKLIMAGVIIDICLMFPVQQVIAAPCIILHHGEKTSAKP